MADTVTSTVLENGSRRLVMSFTNLSDGTGENAVKKVDAQSSTYAVKMQGQSFVPGVNLKVADIFYDIGAMKVRLLWDANTPTDFAILSGFGSRKLLDGRAGMQGLINPDAAGATGSILFTTVGAALNSSYWIVLEMTKGVPQS